MLPASNSSSEALAGPENGPTLSAAKLAAKPTDVSRQLPTLSEEQYGSEGWGFESLRARKKYSLVIPGFYRSRPE